MTTGWFLRIADAAVNNLCHLCHPCDNKVRESPLSPMQNMTQSERWQARYDEVVAFMEENHRRPSKYAAEERLMWNWMRRNMKLMTRGELPAGRMQKFSLQLELADKYRRVNQYV